MAMQKQSTVAAMPRYFSDFQMAAPTHLQNGMVSVKKKNQTGSSAILGGQLLSQWGQNF